ncbi:osmotically inducible protein C [Streptomyces sp. TRM43335]|uniref:Osmotically inducible protein C n=1 Tax=Streptomyces taklimakanensis TaxID=2569853 RepID=A0A6G2B7F5_9ACTN|nr:OsmC family protein [Streptomyces taklimakanensis]MTE17999.1 osmotically inducible protein C [Streptomyces taklimakanensis]
MSPSEQDLYSAEARSLHGTGRVDVSGRAGLPVGAPGELGGSGHGYDPEQLYAAALATCLHQAVVIAATETGVDPTGSEVTARVRLRTGGGQHYAFAATADVSLPSADDGQRERVVAQALRICPLGDQLDPPPA